MVRQMTKVMAPMAIVLAIGIASTTALGAQAMLADQDIAALRAAKHEVFVQVAAIPVEIHGRLITFDATELTIEVDGRSFTFPSNDVLRIDTLGGINRTKLRRGALIGGLVTGAWCALVCGQALDNKDQYPVVVLVNGGIGAAFGSLIRLEHDGRKTIYKSAGTGAAISRRLGDLPCPATPLVLEADLSGIDVRKLPKTLAPVPQSGVFGESRCDGVTIQRRYDSKTGLWQPGVEIAAGSVDESWMYVRVRVTVRKPNGGIDTKVHVNVALRQDGRSQVTGIGSIGAAADQENSGDVWLRVPRALLPVLSSGMSLQLTLTTSYPR